MKDPIRRHAVACATSVLLVLAGCGGGSSDALPDIPAPPLTPAPSLTYSPDATVCAWMAAHLQPFAWPTQSVGPRTWQPARVQTVDTPLRNTQGLAQYRITSNLMVLQSHYAPQIQSKGLTYATSQLWAQEASCKYGINVESQNLTELSYAFTAYMPDSTATRIAQEDYTASIQQVRKSDPCKPEITIPGTPLPPQCQASN